MTQYSKRMVIVHWLTLLLVIAAWYLGDALGDATDESKATLGAYVIHMSVGAAILLLTIARLFFRSRKEAPPLLEDKRIFQIAATGTHHALYTVLVLLPLSGMATVITSSVGRALLAGDASLLPKEHGFRGVFAHEVHETLVNVLIALVVVHILGALKHQFIDKDGLMERMMLRKKD